MVSDVILQLHYTAHLNECRKGRIRAFFLFKLIFSVQLMRAVRYERPEVRYCLKQDITNTFDNSIRFLSFIECIAEAGVDDDDLLDIPKDLLDEIGTAVRRNNIAVFEIIHPDLQGS